MPRQARVVIPGVAHHVTQRGTGRQLVFYTRGDRVAYLRLLKENSERAGLRILAYCLMPNHIHLIAVPGEEESLGGRCGGRTGGMRNISMPGSCVRATCGRTGFTRVRWTSSIFGRRSGTWR